MIRNSKLLNSKLKWIILSFLFNISLQVFSQDKPKNLILNAENEPYVLRCFSKFNDKVKSHSIAVGDPSNFHYILDANSGSILQAWSGEFADVAPMWLSRGGGFFKTPATTKNISEVPPFAILTTDKDQWPDSASHVKNYNFKGYRLDKTGKPVFRYVFNNVTIEDKIVPENGKGLTRELEVSSDNTISKFYVLLAEGKEIKKSSKNIYSVNGNSYSVTLVDSGTKPIIRESNGRKELLVQLTGSKQAKVRYTITL